MANLGDVSVLNINGNEMTIKDAAVREVVNEIIEAIGANNSNIAERINNLHNRSFDYTVKISSNNDSEIASIQDGLYKIQYVTITQSGDDTIETLNNSAILIQQGTNQYLIKDGQILGRTKTNNTWSTWEAQSQNALSVSYVMSSDTNDDLELSAGDTYEEAFGKLEKAITDNELVTSSALNDLNDKVDDIPIYSVTNKMSADNIMDGVTNKVINVKPNWNASAGSDAEILNKPTIPTVPTTSTTVTQNDNNPVSGGAVYNRLADLIGTAPAALDTLGEIATALNNDANLAGTLTTQISSKVPKVSNPTTDNFASFNSDGTIKDSGHKHSDYITSETQLSLGSTIGAGNAITDLTVSNHQITLEKNSTFLTTHQSIKTLNNQTLVGDGNINILGLPVVTASDNGKILMVINGVWTLTAPSVLYSGSGIPNNSNGNNGDLFMQTN